MPAFNAIIPWIPSPNFSDRRGHSPIATVIHYTASGAGASLSAVGDIGWFKDPASRVSSHFLIDRVGGITQMVDLADAAWHAGPSEMAVGGEILHGCNLFTLGIELDNCGLVFKGNSEKFFWESGGHMLPYRGPAPVKAILDFGNGTKIDGWWEPYPDQQIDALISLLKQLYDAGYKDAVHNLVGHEEIATPYAARKQDPGPLFPWAKFARKTTRRTASILVAV